MAQDCHSNLVEYPTCPPGLFSTNEIIILWRPFTVPLQITLSHAFCYFFFLNIFFLTNSLRRQNKILVADWSVNGGGGRSTPSPQLNEKKLNVLKRKNMQKNFVKFLQGFFRLSKTYVLDNSGSFDMHIEKC